MTPTLHKAKIASKALKKNCQLSILENKKGKRGTAKINYNGFISTENILRTPQIASRAEFLAAGGIDANPNETKNEPNYEDWGEDHAKLDYVGLISYTVAAINELREMVEELENA